MLSKQDKEVIRSQINFDKVTSDVNWQRPSIPSFIDLKEQAINQILALGYSQVDLVSPRIANCIIRLYKKFDIAHEETNCHAYGYHSFLHENGYWYTTFDSGKTLYPIDFSKCAHSLQISQDESLEFDADFFDIYVSIR